MSKKFQPIQPQQRILTADVLRGFALFGILIVNIQFFALPFQHMLTDMTFWSGWLNQAVVYVVRFIAETKFYPLFSLLFGWGLSVYILKSKAQETPYVGHYVRRLFVLMFFGIIHIVFFWIGDILLFYALLGFVLLLFRNLSPKALLIWAGVLLMIPIGLNLILWGFLELVKSIPEAAAEMENAMILQAEQYYLETRRLLEVYASGTFMEITKERINDYAFSFLFYLMVSPNILAMFLIGLCIGKLEILQEPEKHLKVLKWMMMIGLFIGLPANIGLVWAQENANMAMPNFESTLVISFMTIGGTAFCLMYFSIITRLLMSERWKKRLSPLAAMGRIALTNYLMQSLILSFIFYGYGFGLHGKTGPAIWMMIAVCLYAFQMAFSVWWIKRFRFGPLEWVWRKLTYF